MFNCLEVTGTCTVYMSIRIYLAWSTMATEEPSARCSADVRDKISTRRRLCRVESTALRLRAVRQGRARLTESRAFFRSQVCGAVRSRPDSPARRARAFLRASPCFKHAELVQMDLMHHRPSDTGSQKQHGLRGSLLRQGRIKTEATAPAAANDRPVEQSGVAGP